MFGITSGPEKYQKIVKDVLIGCKRIANIADDLIIHECGIIEHDENLLAVLRRLRERGITLNQSRSQSPRCFVNLNGPVADQKDRGLWERD